MNPFPPSFTIRAALFAPLPLPALRALDVPGIAGCQVIRNEADIAASVAALCPHALVLWDAPRAPDALEAALCRMQHPPHILSACDDAASAVFDAMRRPCPPLAMASLPRREAVARRYLYEIGTSAALLGFDCIVRGAALLSVCRPLQYQLIRRVGPQAAQRYLSLPPPAKGAARSTKSRILHAFTFPLQKYAPPGPICLPLAQKSAIMKHPLLKGALHALFTDQRRRL